MTLAGAVWSEAICNHVEVVYGEFIVKHISVLLCRRSATILAASAVHSGGVGGSARGCVCAAAMGLHSPVSNPPASRVSVEAVSSGRQWQSRGTRRRGGA